MGILKNDVGRPSNKTIKIRFILKLLLLIIVAGGLFIGGYLLNDYQKEESKKVESNQEESSSIDTKKYLSIDEAEKILYGIFDDYKFYHFSEEVFNSDNFKTYVAITKTTKTYEPKYSCKELFGDDVRIYFESDTWIMDTNYDMSLLCQDYSENGYYVYEDVNGNYKKMFGNEKDAVKELVNFGFADNYAYSKYKDVYMGLSCECGEGGYGVIYGVTNAYKQNSNLYIDFVHGTYRDYNNNWALELIDSSLVNLTDDEMESKDTYKKYQDKLEKYTFVFFKEDGVYKFKELTKK